MVNAIAVRLMEISQARMETATYDVFRDSVSAHVYALGNNRPARIAAVAGRTGDKPTAIRSALTKAGQSASLGRYSSAKVVLPAPFGPAMIMTFLSGIHRVRWFRGVRVGTYSLLTAGAGTGTP